MNNKILLREDIIRELTLIPSERLKEIDSYIIFISSQTQQKRSLKEPKTLAGIWKNKGFERIVNIDKEITITRKDLDNQILNKKF